MIRTPAIVRALPNASRLSARSVAPLNAISQVPAQRRDAHAISNPTLAAIEKRWPEMPPQEQAELWMALRDRMKVDWKEMTTQEKKAAYWIAFGPHGPRAQDPPGEGWYVFRTTMTCVVLSVALYFGIKAFARPPPSTMNKEWQEATEAYLKENNIEPITGISNPAFKGNFSVQSPPKDQK